MAQEFSVTITTAMTTGFVEIRGDINLELAAAAHLLNRNPSTQDIAPIIKLLLSPGRRLH